MVSMGGLLILGWVSWSSEMSQATPQDKSTMKCLLQECKFSQWLLLHEGKRYVVAIMVCPLFLLKNTTCKIGRIILPMGISISNSTLQKNLPMNINISAIYGSKILWKQVSKWQLESKSRFHTRNQCSAFHACLKTENNKCFTNHFFSAIVIS